MGGCEVSLWERAGRKQVIRATVRVRVRVRVRFRVKVSVRVRVGVRLRLSGRGRGRGITSVVCTRGRVGGAAALTMASLTMATLTMAIGPWLPLLWP